MRIARRTMLFFPALLLASAIAPRAFAQDQSKRPTTPTEVVTAQWDDIGRRLVAMAEDWPENKYTYRPNDQVRTFQQVLLHVAGSNFGLLNKLRGEKLGNEDNDPSVDMFKTKAQTVEFLKKSIAEGDATIKQEGDAGVLKHLNGWVGYTEHMGEHYGLLVGYYRFNNMVPPESRPQK